MNSETPPLGKTEATSRGFEIVKFKDCYGRACSLQMSSLAEYEQPGASAVWLGIEDAEPKVMARDAAMVGVTTKETTGWVDYPIPHTVRLTTRMHLNREQAAALIEHLKQWLEENTFEYES